MKANNLKIDYALTCFYSMLALYGAGVGISNVALGLVLMGLVLVGMVLSYSINSKLTSKGVESASGIVYALTAAAVIFFIVPLNSLLPEGGFPRDLMIASIMCWLITLGAFTAWSENVLLFQAIPSLSLLSMVGIWETYSGSILSFVLFLLSVTVILSRAHNRAMFRLAEESGYSKLKTISNGPWKRMAGPEWVLGFAAAVIVLSSIGAPFIQNMFKPFSGTFRAALPKSLAKNRDAIDPIMPPSTIQTSVGTGPHTPGDKIMLLAQLDEPRYLKDGYFELYTGSGWLKDMNAVFPDDRVWKDGNKIYRKVYSQKKLRNPKTIDYMILPVYGSINRVPVPGDAYELRLQVDESARTAKSTRLDDSGLPRYYGKSYVVDPAFTPRDKANIETGTIRDAYTMVATTDRVRQLAESVANEHKTDYAKAVALKQTIESMVKYNLKAAAVPANRDAADYFLFDSKEGYCDLFATTMVVMARCAGIPARYVTGFYPINNEKDGMGRTVLRSSDRHAWAELFFEGAGWVPFDATEGALDINGNERGGSGIHEPWYKSAAFTTVLNVSLVVAVGGLFLVAFSDRLRPKALFSKRRLGKAPVDRSNEIRRQIGIQYGLLSRSIARSTGLARQPEMSPNEYADLVQSQLGELGAKISSMTNVFVSALYSGTIHDDESLANVKRETQQLRSELRRIRPEGSAPPIVAAIVKPIESAIGLIRTIFSLRAMDKKDRLAS